MTNVITDNRLKSLEDRVFRLEQKDRKHNRPLGGMRRGSRSLIIKAEKEGIERRSKNKQK